MPTELQKQSLNIIAKKRKQKKPFKMANVMLEAGYSKSISRNPKTLTESKGWEQLLAKYNDEPIMNLIYEEALNRKDKRNATTNRDIYLKLKDRYPKQETKVVGLFAKIKDLEG